MGYVKEESQPLIKRMQAELAARPAMKGVFGASFAAGSLYEMRLGLDGVITGMGHVCRPHGSRASGSCTSTDATTTCATRYGRFLLMRNLDESIPGTDLYVMKKRGIFKTTVRRTSAPQRPCRPKLNEFIPSPSNATKSNSGLPR